MTKNGLKMIMKFNEIWNLCVLSGRGWKSFVNEAVEEVANVVVERAFSSSYFLASA